MYCSHCGSVCEDDSKFCSHCGNAVTPAVTPKQPPVQAPTQPLAQATQESEKLSREDKIRNWFGIIALCAIAWAFIIPIVVGIFEMFFDIDGIYMDGLTITPESRVENTDYTSRTEHLDYTSQDESFAALQDLLDAEYLDDSDLHMGSSERELKEQKEAFEEKWENEKDFYLLKASGEFSEGLAFAIVNGPIYGGGYEERPAYVKTNGEVAFFLPPELPYGSEFHEDYAVISSIPFPNAYSQHGYIENWQAEFALVDREGNYKIEPGKYRFIGRVSEGLLFTGYAKKDYNGTELELAFRDVDENVVVPVDKTIRELEDVGKSYFRNGITYIQTSSFAPYRFLNRNGDEIYSVKGVGPLEGPFYSETADFFAYRNWDIKIFNRNSGESIVTPFRDDVFEVCFEFVDGVSMLRRKNGEIDAIDTEGNILARNADLNAIKVSSTDRPLWILKLQNDYFGVIDKDAQLMFEPVQDTITYAGEGLFLQEKNKIICDEKGKTVLDLEDCEIWRFIKPFSEGYSIVYSEEWADVPTYMDRNGKVLMPVLPQKKIDAP